MRVNYKYGIIFTAFLLFFCYGVLSQTAPPEPQMSTNSEDVPCKDVEDDPNVANPPPPGLCLPIDDYIPFLIIGGMLIGLICTRPKAAKPDGIH